MAQLQNITTNNGNNVAENLSQQPQSTQIGSSLTPFLEPEALERLSRVSLVRPDRAQSVEQYLQQLISTGQLRHKISENEIVEILNGVAKEQNKRNETKIIFNRKDKYSINDKAEESKHNDQYDSEDDFFDE